MRQEQLQKSIHKRTVVEVDGTFPEVDERIYTSGGDGPDIDDILEINDNFWSEEFARRALALAEVEPV